MWHQANEMKEVSCRYGYGGVEDSSRRCAIISGPTRTLPRGRWLAMVFQLLTDRGNKGMQVGNQTFLATLLESSTMIRGINVIDTVQQ
jgi:hypothetical protein